MLCCLRGSSINVSDLFSSVTSRKSRDSNSIDYYSFLAPSVFHLQNSFLSEIEKAGLPDTSTLYEVENLLDDTPGVIRQKGLGVVCPMDGRQHSAYVHALAPLGIDHVGTATHMLSYTWGYTVRDIVDTLVAYCEANGLDTKRTYIWMCALCNNQHRISEQDVSSDAFQELFSKRVSGIGNVLAMMAPWQMPTYLTRVWCVFEMFTANSDTTTNVEIIMPPKEKDSLIQSVQKGTDTQGRSGLDDLFTALANTKVENASASQPDDKENILKLIENGPGYHALNIEINHLMRTWVKNVIIEAVQSAEQRIQNNDDIDQDYRRDQATFMAYCASSFSSLGAHKEALDLHQKALDIYQSLEDYDNEELRARCYNNIGTEHESLAEYDKALENHEKCLEIFERRFGTDHEYTSSSYFNIGAVKKKKGDLDGALEMYQKSIDIDKKVKGEHHPDVSMGYNYIGRILTEREDYNGAIDMFQKALKIREDTFGTNHPNTSHCYGEIGILYHMQQDYKSAVEWHKKSLSIQETVMGRFHPDTASVYLNIGGALYHQGLYSESIQYLEKSKAAYVASLGEDHPKTDVTNQWIELVQQSLPVVA